MIKRYGMVGHLMEDGSYVLYSEYEKEIAALNRIVEECSCIKLKERDEQLAALTNVVKDMDETEKGVREILRPLIDVDGDSYGVPGLEDLAKSVVDKIALLTTEFKELREHHDDELTTAYDQVSEQVRQIAALTAERDKLVSAYEQRIKRLNNMLKPFLEKGKGGGYGSI